MITRYKKIGFALCIAILLSARVFAQTSFVKQGNHWFENLAYANAIEWYENALKKGKNLSGSDLQQARTKLAYSYRQIRDSQNAERVYRELINSGNDFTGDDAKVYLYFAQALASNGKYKESQEAYDKYNQKQSEDVRKGFSKLYQNVGLLSKNASSYKVEYLSINSSAAEFSPMYFKNGMVFCSDREEGGSIKRVFCWNQRPFLDLLYLDDISLVGGQTAAGLGGSDVAKRKRSKSDRELGSDEYTSPTANDAKTIGTFGSTNVGSANSFTEKPLTDTDKFSKDLNTKYHEGPATFTQDAAKVLFTRNNYNDGKFKMSSDGVNKLKIYTAELKGNDWSNVKEVPFNSDEYSTGHPSLSKDEKLLYFVSDMPGGYGGTDLYVVSYNAGEFGTPVNLGKEINTKGNEMFPFVDEKGNLFFSSDGHPGLGELDMFFVQMKNASANGKVTNLGAPMNSNKDDFGIIADGERKSGFFSSNRKRGGADDDIYRFTRDGALNPCRDVLVNVFDVETKAPLANSVVEIEMGDGKTETQKTDAEGIAKLCLDENLDFGLKANHEGYLANTAKYSTKQEFSGDVDRVEIPLAKVKEEQPVTSPSNGIGPAVDGKVSTLRGRVLSQKDKQPMEGVLVTLRNDCDGTTQQVVTGPDGTYQFDLKDGCDYTVEASKDNYGTRGNKIAKVKAGQAPEYINADVTMFETGDVITLENIYYDLDKCNIRPDAAVELDKLVSLMQKYSNMKIELRSHTDSRADAAYNQKLSDGRTKTAKRYVVKRGISGSRIVAKGYGETQLVNECADGVPCNEEQHQLNRRTEIKILQLK